MGWIEPSWSNSVGFELVYLVTIYKMNSSFKGPIQFGFLLDRFDPKLPTLDYEDVTAYNHAHFLCAGSLWSLS